MKPNGFIALLPILIAAVMLVAGSGVAYYFVSKRPVNAPEASIQPSVMRIAITPEATVSSKSSTPKSIVKSPASTPVSPTPTPSSTVDPVVLQECQTVSKKIDYFNGMDCYATSDTRRLYNAAQGPKDPEWLRRMVLSYNGDIEGRLVNACALANKDRYERCSSSLDINVGRIQNEWLTNHPYEPACLANTSDDAEMTRDFHWRLKMKDNLERIYTFCYSHGDSLDDFHL